MSRWLRFGLSVLVLLAVLPFAHADLAPPFPGPRPFPRPGPVPNPGPLPGPGVAPAGQRVKVVVEIDNTVRVAKLQIPIKLIPAAAGAGAAPARPGQTGLQGADAGPSQTPTSVASEETPEETREAGPRRTPTIVAGAALALTFASGGFWLVRRRNGRGAVPFLVALLALGISGTLLWANAVFPRPQPNPGVPPPRFPPNFPPNPGFPNPGFPNPGFPNPNPRVVPPVAGLPQLILPAHIRLDGNLVLEFVNTGDDVKLIVNKAMVIRTTGVKRPPAGGRVPTRPPIMG